MDELADFLFLADSWHVRIVVKRADQDIREIFKEKLGFSEEVQLELSSYLDQQVKRHKEQLELEEAQIELLEKQSALAKRLRKLKRLDSCKTWSSHWVASPIAYLLPVDCCEEWLGDLYEGNYRMLYEEGFPRWRVNVNNVGKTAILIVSSLQIKLSDFISSAIGRRS